MRSRSATGRSKPTWRTTRAEAPHPDPAPQEKRASIPQAGRASIALIAGLVIAPLAAFYLYQAFTNPSPGLRILLRTLPVVPAAIWTLWFDRTRPFQALSPAPRQLARGLALAAILGFAVLVLGFGLNWVYDLNRIH